MNSEELKIVMDALQGIGETAGDAFLAWLLISEALPVLGWVVVAGITAWAANRFFSAMSGRTDQDNAVKFLRERWLIGAPGPLTPDEQRRVLTKLAALEALEAQQK